MKQNHSRPNASKSPEVKSAFSRLASSTCTCSLKRLVFSRSGPHEARQTGGTVSCQLHLVRKYMQRLSIKPLQLLLRSSRRDGQIAPVGCRWHTTATVLRATKYFSQFCTNPQFPLLRSSSFPRSSFATHRELPHTDNTQNTPPSATTPHSEPEPESTPSQPLAARPIRSIGEILLIWVLLILVSLIYSYPFGAHIEDLMQELANDQLSPEQRTRKLWRLLMMMGLAASQLESRGGEPQGRVAIRKEHPKLLQALVSAAKSDDPDVRLAADSAIAWLFDSYNYTTAHAELGGVLSELSPYVSKDLLARNADHPELTDTRLPLGPWVLLLHMAMRDETREILSDEIAQLVNKKAQQLSARDHRLYENSWFIPTFMDQPVHLDSQIIHMIRSQLLLTPRFANFLQHPANAVNLHHLDNGLHMNSLVMSTIGTVWDRTSVLEREFLTCSLAAVLWGAFRGARSTAATINVRGILRSVRMSRGTRSARASGAAASILGTSLFLLLSHTIPPAPQNGKHTSWPNARVLFYWASLLPVAAVPYTAVPAMCALQTHIRAVSLPPRAAGPERVRLN